MIGILGILDEEVTLFREALTDRTTVEKAGNLFHCGKIILTAFGLPHGELADQDRLIAADPGLIEAATKAFDQLPEDMQPLRP